MNYKERVEQLVATRYGEAADVVMYLMSRVIDDIIVPIPAIKMTEGRLEIPGKGTLGLSDWAFTQLADKLGVPSQYAKRLRNGESWEKTLLDTTVTEHTTHASRRWLIRSVGDSIEGVLSDRYKRLNTPQLLSAFIKALPDDAKLVGGTNDGGAYFIEAVKQTPFEVRTMNNGTIPLVVGVRMRNSDFGRGALDIRTFFINLLCTNGMVGPKLMRQVHLGRVVDENVEASLRTIKLETEAAASAIDDIVSAVFDEKNIYELSSKIQGASLKIVKPEEEIKRLPKLGVAKWEVEEVQRILLNNDPNDGVTGAPSRWKVGQALTAVARDHKDSFRREELYEIAGNYVFS